jgi:hypothetical protein
MIWFSKTIHREQVMKNAEALGFSFGFGTRYNFWSLDLDQTISSETRRECAMPLGAFLSSVGFPIVRFLCIFALSDGHAALHVSISELDSRNLKYALDIANGGTVILFHLVRE